MSDNLALWNSVSETDPKYTKGFNRGGGFKGTSTNATYLARKATERWGPIGIGWGVEVLDEELMQGKPLVTDNGPVTHELIHKVRAKLWYKQDGETGEVMHFGQTTFVGLNKNGLFTDEEAPKKSLTDAMAKCLSLLGFSADIFMGLYDDNKYVNDLRQKFANRDEPPAGKPSGNAHGNGTQKPAARNAAKDMELTRKSIADAGEDFPYLYKLIDYVDGEMKAGTFNADQGNELHGLLNQAFLPLMATRIDETQAENCDKLMAWIVGRGFSPDDTGDLIALVKKHKEQQVAAPAPSDVAAGAPY